MLSHMEFFSDQELGVLPPTHEDITPEARDGILGIIRARVGDDAFGVDYPNPAEPEPNRDRPKKSEIRSQNAPRTGKGLRSPILFEVPPNPHKQRAESHPSEIFCQKRAGSEDIGTKQDCPDGNAITGTNLGALRDVVKGYRLCWPWDYPCEPDTYQLLDLVQFCYQKVAKPQRGSWHSYGKHYHLTFDRPAGQAEFREEVNLVFRRHGLVYELADNGQIQRLSPAILRDALATALFNTGDSHLDQMLESARDKFRDRDPAVRKESLEELWDAWERLKTVEPGKDKKESVARLLDKASSEGRFRDILEQEATELTGIGNSFMIRHTEMDKTPIETSEHVDYLFHRMFALIRLLLRRSGRGG